MCLCEFDYHGRRVYVCSLHSGTGAPQFVGGKPRFTVANPPRVWEIAKMHGTTSKIVKEWLNVMGCPVKSASSRVPLPYWHGLYQFSREYLNF